MDGLAIFLDRMKREPAVQEEFLGLLHLLIGRRLQGPEGKVISRGVTWRDLANLLKKVRWNPEAVRTLGLDPDALPPRDRQKYWYTAILRAGVDSESARQSAHRLGHWLILQGFQVGNLST